VIAGVILFLILLALDLQNLGSRWGRHLRVSEEIDEDFTFVVPLFGSPHYFRNGDYLRRYMANTLLAVNVDSDEMRRFADQAEADGWRVHRAYIEGRVACPTLVRAALESVDTTYVIRIDGDTFTEQHPGLAVAAVRRGMVDLCSVRVHVANSKRLVERLQAIEYEMSMLGRRNRPWMTSGAAMIARTEVFKVILDHHSGWFPGEDIETGVIANHFRQKVSHVDFVFLTEAPDTFRSWFRQRRMWWSGSFRMAFVNADQTIRYPITFAYTACAVWLLLIGKWNELFNIRSAIHVVPFLILIYTLLSIVANWEVRSRWMIAIPYYALFQALVVPIFGAGYYLVLWRRTGSWKPPGRYRIGFRRQPLPERAAP
jgi:cellulose synthase/poly-beta-1,6-N-acetylglucosamine synthase-like glycosyltransferase